LKRTPPLIPFLAVERPRTFRWVVVPAPFERSTTYMKGTGRGPAAVLEATSQVEFYDHYSGGETYKKIGIGTDLEWKPSPRTLTLDKIQKRVEHWLARGVRTALIGGEHTVTLPAVRAYKKHFKRFGVVQWDAHSDLRNAYEHSPFNHACVMRRVWDEGIPVLPLGIRALCQEEADFLRKGRRPVMFAHELDLKRFSKLLDRLPELVYLSVDVDAFDPSVVPTTGTPEPGGLTWAQGNAFLELIARKKEIIGMDLVEAMPAKGLEHGIFACARFLYRMLTCAGRRSRRKPC
jgi:agmatinase